MFINIVEQCTGQPCNRKEKTVQTITNKIKMQQVLYTRDAVRQTTEGGFHRVFRKNVSYNKYEDHIQKIEKELMKKTD